MPFPVRVQEEFCQLQFTQLLYLENWITFWIHAMESPNLLSMVRVHSDAWSIGADKDRSLEDIFGDDYAENGDINRVGMLGSMLLL
jgi:hypothetical protein